MNSTQVPTQNDSQLENLHESISRALAGRISRRSFMGRLGKGMIAASLGTAGGVLVRAESAEGSHGGCPSGCTKCACSVSCSYLPGWNQASCPTNGYGTCACGSWCFSTAECGSGIRRWTDCCGINYCNVNPGGGCRCISSVSRPACCYHKTYGGGCGDSNSIIACRSHQCVSSCAITPYYCG